MRKMIMILGTLLITMLILISGTTVATWVWVQSVSSSSNCTDEDEMRFAPDNVYGSLGVELTATLGWAMLDLGSSNYMLPNQEFSVNATSPVNETYNVSVGETSDPQASTWVGTGYDDHNMTFQTPSTPDLSWRYIFLEGISGVRLAYGGDYAYGPDIDAVGWDKT